MKIKTNKIGKVMLSTAFILGMVVPVTNISFDAKEVSSTPNTAVTQSYMDTDTAKINANRAAGKFDLPDDALEQTIMDAAKYTGALGTMDESELLNVTMIVEASGTGIISTFEGMDYYISKGLFDNLTNIYITSGTINDISPLKNLPSIEDLTIYDTDLNNVDTVASFTTLKNLDLGFNQITTIPPLSTLVNLEFLSLSENDISDVTPLLSINSSSIYEVNLNKNNISDVAPLSNLKSYIPTLDLEENHIIDFSPLFSANASGMDIRIGGQILNFNLGEFDDISKIPTEVSVYDFDGTEYKTDYGFNPADISDYKEYTYGPWYYNMPSTSNLTGEVNVTFSYVAPIPLTPIGPSDPIIPLTPLEPSIPIDNTNNENGNSNIDNSTDITTNNSKTNDKSDITNDNHTLPELEETGLKVTSFILSITAIVISSITLLLTNKKKED